MVFYPTMNIVSYTYDTNGLMQGVHLPTVTLTSNRFVLNISKFDHLMSMCGYYKDHTVYELFRDVHYVGNNFSIDIITPFGLSDLHPEPIEDNNDVRFHLPKEMNFYCSVESCTSSGCIIAKDITATEGTYNTNGLIIRNSRIEFLSSRVVIRHNPVATEAYIIVNGGTLVTSYSTLVYRIDSVEYFHSIEDGSTIHLIDTKNDGLIVGFFKDVKVVTPIESYCRVISGQLQESEERVYIRILVFNPCDSLPGWAISLIVFACLAFIAVIAFSALIKTQTLFKGRARL